MEITSYLLGKKAGGTPTPQTMTEFGETLTNIYHSYQNYLKGTIANYPTTTSEATTLYTPNEKNKHYIIYKTSSNKYMAVWVMWDVVRLTTVSQLKYSPIQLYTYGKDPDGNWSSTISFLQDGNYFNVFAQDPSKTIYYVLCDTLEDAINALKSSTTQYSNSLTSGGGYSSYSADYVIPYTNMVVFDNKVSKTFTQLTSQRISSNETIQVIS